MVDRMSGVGVVFVFCAVVFGVACAGDGPPLLIDSLGAQPVAVMRAAPPAGDADGREYDILPIQFKELGKYDQIALEPYRDRYDKMPINEKARVYSQAFAFMHNRNPNFSPEILDQIAGAEQAANARSAYDAKKYLYKPPAEKSRRRARSQEQERSDDPNAALLSGIAVPWAGDAEDEPEETAVEEQDTGGQADYRMESLRFRR